MLQVGASGGEIFLHKGSAFIMAVQTDHIGVLMGDCQPRQPTGKRMLVRRPEGETRGRTLPTSVALIKSLLGILPTYITLLWLTNTSQISQTLDKSST